MVIYIKSLCILHRYYHWGGEKVKFLLLLLIILLAALLVLDVGVAIIRAYNIYQYKKMKQRKTGRRPKRSVWKDELLQLLLIVGVVVLILLLVMVKAYKKPREEKTTPERATKAAQISTQLEDSAEAQPDNVQPVQLIIEDSASAFKPHCVDSTDPSNWAIRWEKLVDGKVVTDYKREEGISFGDADEYFTGQGIVTFRGDNYRSGATYGTAQVINETIQPIWKDSTGSLPTSSGSSEWTGSGWTGQPLIVKWDAETRSIMNMYSSVPKDVTEAIYATLDGHIYFINIDDGSYTRDPIDIGMAFKGAGSLDPRGYPLMYVGSGDNTSIGKRPRMYIISLIDGTVLWEYGHNDEYANRHDNDSWCAFDSSPLVDAETDTLIWPGENGVLYTIKLNTKYDKTSGKISVNPAEPVRTRYTTMRSSNDAYWLGYECSASIIDRYLYLSENGGMFYCVNLDTMELVWCQDTEDDSNSSPVIEYDSETKTGYIYTAPSLHWRADNYLKGDISIFKLNALTGEIVWRSTYQCNTVRGVSGGVQASPLLGKKGTSLEGLIIYPIARTPGVESGTLVALNTKTGKEAWRVSMEHYTWSSPAAVYTADGRGYVVQCDSIGNVFFIEGISGKILSTTSVETLVEASPAVYEDKIVVGTRGQRIFGLQVK